MKEISFEEVKKMWLEKTWRPDETFHLYVDGPFCLKKCDFCIYNPTETQVNSELYKKYYEDFLLSQIDDFKDVILSRKPRSIYFGGGTASYMSSAIMRKVFDAIPGFKEIPHKDFEAHPMFIDKKKIDILAEYGVNYLSLGVQTFNERVLEKNGRIHLEPKKLAGIVRYAQEKGIFVNCDLLAFIDKGDVEDLSFFEKDLDLMAKIINPDNITVFPKYQVLAIRYSIFDDGKTSKYKAEWEREQNYSRIVKLRRSMLKFTRRHKGHEEIYGNLTLSKDSILKDSKINYSLSSRDKKDVSKYFPYTSSGYPHQPDHQCTLALGGYGPRMPYSYFGRRLFYCTQVDDSMTARYLLRFDGKKEY